MKPEAGIPSPHFPGPYLNLVLHYVGHSGIFAAMLSLC